MTVDVIPNPGVDFLTERENLKKTGGASRSPEGNGTTEDHKEAAAPLAKSQPSPSSRITHPARGVEGHIKLFLGVHVADNLA